MDDVRSWMVGRLPDEWFTEDPEVTADREEIIVVGRLATPTGIDETGARSAEAGRIRRFREDTREQRMQIADEAEERFGRKVAWGAACGETREVFTNLAIPVMTRLRQPERQVLDTLVAAGVARSRADALAWTVRLVGQHEQDWLTDLRDALVSVQQAREAGPKA